MEATLRQDPATLQASTVKCTWHAHCSSHCSGAGVSCCFRTAASKKKLKKKINHIIPFSPQQQSGFNGTITSSTFSQAWVFMDFIEQVLTACVQTHRRPGQGELAPGAFFFTCLLLRGNWDTHTHTARIFCWGPWGGGSSTADERLLPPPSPPMAKIRN